MNATSAANPHTEPTDLDCECTRKKWQQPSTSIIAILSLLGLRADTHFSVPRKVKGRVDLGTAVRVCSPCQRLYRSGCSDNTYYPWRDSNLGPLTPQSGMSPLDHRDTAINAMKRTSAVHLMLNAFLQKK